MQSFAIGWDWDKFSWRFGCWRFKWAGDVFAFDFISSSSRNGWGLDGVGGVGAVADDRGGQGAIILPMADEKQSEPEKAKPAEAEAAEVKPVEEMSEEEQLAAYEEEMKNSDWGHQPC